jgi:cytochrome oxidase Cu insertion factor (SCO1/SenC/PrrC family)
MLAAALFAVLSFAPQLNVGDSAPATSMVDQDGRPFSFDQLRGRAVVLSFIYTRCTDSCALVAAKLVKLARESDPARVAVVALTVDPQYDRPPILQQYRRRFSASADVTLATGLPNSVIYLERRFGAEAAARPGGHIDHADLAVVLDPRGRIASFVRGSDWTTRQLEALAMAASGTAQNPLVALQLFLDDAAARCGQAAGSLTFGAALILVGALTIVIGLPLVAAVLRTGESR